MLVRLNRKHQAIRRWRPHGDSNRPRISAGPLSKGAASLSASANSLRVEQVIHGSSRREIAPITNNIVSFQACHDGSKSSNARNAAGADGARSRRISSPRPQTSGAWLDQHCAVPAARAELTFGCTPCCPDGWTHPELADAVGLWISAGATGAMPTSQPA